jgi:hypothetical protein
VIASGAAAISVGGEFIVKPFCAWVRWAATTPPAPEEEEFTV